MLSSLRGPLVLFVSAVLLAAAPTTAVFAANAGDQQYIDPFANGSANPAPAQPAPKPRPAKPQSPSAHTPSAGSSPSPSAGAGSPGPSRPAAGGSTTAPGPGVAGATPSPSAGGAPTHAAAKRHRGAGTIVQILGTGDAALLGVAERVPVVGNALRTGEHA